MRLLKGVTSKKGTKPSASTRLIQNNKAVREADNGTAEDGQDHARRCTPLMANRHERVTTSHHHVSDGILYRSHEPTLDFVFF